ncbi:hypothetical protein [Aquirufa ecclesiirivi]|uniref:hypothetical protein n=1 Tax=Aquirufa ecclesiirivi TaxID=2715124 RepID=UPI00140A43E4|nr:hypothetical protein [Aquirufa ecclesiirivi]NHC49574.1 hypothetical protein [Aquirufa ecclesiirivi]
MGCSAGVVLDLYLTERISWNAEASRMNLFSTQEKGPNLDGISLSFGINDSFGDMDKYSLK